VAADRAIRGLLVAAVLIAAWGVDTGALAAFDAPKRAGVLPCIALASCIAIWRWRAVEVSQPVPWSSEARLAVGACTAAALCVALSTWASLQPAVAHDAARGLFLWSLLLPLGACLRDRLDRGALALAFALAIGSSAVLSVLQRAGITPGFELTHLAGHFPSGALMGNEGYVALACALALPACAHALSAPGTRATRGVALALAIACVAAIGVNRQVTAALAAAAGIGVVIALQARAWRLVAGALALGAVLVMTAALPALRAVTWDQLLATRVAQIQQATTYRLGAWAAAESMWRERPALGHGPGTYATHSLPHRLQAELRVRERLTPPPTATHFLQAHDDYLQFAAEAGVPALLAALAAFGAIMSGLLVRSVQSPEARVLAGVLAAGAVAALAWFPLQMPLTALMLLLAAGRAWRLVATRVASR
jgi:O-antigen ligase